MLIAIPFCGRRGSNDLFSEKIHMTDSGPVLVVERLTKSYPTPEGELSILRGVDLAMTRGDALAITGPSGSGKSTLLYILGALDSPTSGHVTLAGQRPFELSQREQAQFRNMSVGFIFQDHHLLPQCSVLENVLIPTLAGRGTDAAVESRALQLLQRVGLADRLTHRPAQLSGGERQRVAVCRSLINNPILLLADEPTGNLDRTTAESVGSLLLELNREQNTLLICVTHSPELANRFPRHGMLKDGHLEE
jgi:lipoprotein-releasing system ATP-binding protein